jgi:hypothetical protein
MEQQPIYRSKRSFMSFWHEYRIFDDRVELHVLLKTITVPFDEVEGAEVANSYLEGVRLQLRGGKMGIKLDLADWNRHVVLDKSTGFFRHIAFTPDDPDMFRATLETALARFREKQGGKE